MLRCVGCKVSCRETSFFAKTKNNRETGSARLNGSQRILDTVTCQLMVNLSIISYMYHNIRWTQLVTCILLVFLSLFLLNFDGLHLIVCDILSNMILSLFISLLMMIVYHNGYKIARNNTLKLSILLCNLCFQCVLYYNCLFCLQNNKK